MDMMRIKYSYRDTSGEVKPLCSHNCKSYGEFIKMLQYCKDNETEFWIREDDTQISDEAKQMINCGSTIEDFWISFGSDDCIQIIEVLLH